MPVRKRRTPATSDCALSGAELRIRRSAMGMTLAVASDVMAVSRRSVQYWEHDPHHPVEYETFIGEMEVRFWSTVASLVEGAMKQAEKDGSPLIALAYANDKDLWEAHPKLKPMSATMYDHALAAAIHAAPGSGGVVRVADFDAAAYAIWLAGKSDTLARRNAWAAAQLQQ